MYFALIGDIVASKKIEKRIEAQTKLENILNKLNDEYHNELDKKMSITLGDEFQGLFKDGKYILELIHKIELEMYPHKLRFGIGIGTILFDFGDFDSPYRSDGDVWWNARKAIEKVRSKSKKQFFSNIYVMSNDDEFNEEVNTFLDLCYAIKKEWTPIQIDLIKFTVFNYGLTRDFTYKNVAKRYKQSNSNIFERYKASKYEYYVNAMQVLSNKVVKEGAKHDI